MNYWDNKKKKCRKLEDHHGNDKEFINPIKWMQCYVGNHVHIRWTNYQTYSEEKSRNKGTIEMKNKGNQAIMGHLKGQ